MQITYQKRDGSIIQRYRNTMLPYKIGEETSMGWKVLNIEYEYKDKYYPEFEYSKIIHKIKQDTIKKRNTIDSIKSEFKKFMYYFIAVVLVNVLKLILGI